MQTRRQSLYESITNVMIGYLVALASQLVILPLYGVELTLGQNIGIGAWFTLISIVRSYVVRRWYNRIQNPERIA